MTRPQSEHHDDPIDRHLIAGFIAYLTISTATTAVLFLTAFGIIR